MAFFSVTLVVKTVTFASLTLIYTHIYMLVTGIPQGIFSITVHVMYAWISIHPKECNKVQLDICFTYSDTECI